MATKNNTKTHKGTMFGISLPDQLTYANGAYLASVFVTFILTALLWRITSGVQAESDAQLKRYQTQAQLDIADAQRAAAVADQKAEEARERTTTLELQLEQTKQQVAVATETAEKLRLAILNIKRPRILSADGMSKLHSIFVSSPPILYKMAVSSDDAEVTDLALQLRSVLKGIGWIEQKWINIGVEIAFVGEISLPVIPAAGIVVQFDAHASMDIRKAQPTCAIRSTQRGSLGDLRFLSWSGASKVLFG